MKKLSLALIALSAFCNIAVAQAKPTEGPKVVSNVAEAQKLGERRLQLTQELCQVKDAYKASDSTWMGDMPEEKFKVLLRDCVQGIADVKKADEPQQLAQRRSRYNDDQLDDMIMQRATKIFGPVPANAKWHHGKVIRKGESPEPGCRVIASRHVPGKGTYQRWKCPNDGTSD